MTKVPLSAHSSNLPFSSLLGQWFPLTYSLNNSPAAGYISLSLPERDSKLQFGYEVIRRTSREGLAS
jgi:hypothetical protein